MRIFFFYPGYFYPAIAAMLLLLFFYWRKKFAIRDFSYLPLVRQAFQQLSVWERWRNRLLLVIRLVILFLIAAIFARPFYYWFSPHKSGSGIDVVVGVDNSFSLGWTSHRQSNLQRAKELVRRLTSFLPENTAIALFSFGDTVNWYSEKFTYSAEELNRWLEAVVQKNEETNPAVAIRFAQKILENRASPNKIILILTDGQRTFLEKENFRRDFELVRALIRQEKVIFLEVNPEKLPNYSLSHFQLRADALVGQLNNYGFTPEKPVFVTVYHQRKIIGRKFFLPKKELESIEVSFNRQELPEWGEIEISPDNLIADNRYYFVLPAETSREVLIFDGDPQFGSARAESFYLRQALTAFNWHCRIATESDFSQQTLKKYRWVILANWRLKEGEAAVLKEFTESGGNILIFSGDKINPDIYNQQDWLPVVIGDVLPEKKSLRPVFMPVNFLPWPDFDWEKISVRALAVQAKKDSQQFILLENNLPLLVGKDSVYFLGTTADGDWGNLAVKPAYSFILEKILTSFAEAAGEIPGMLNSGELHLLKDSVVVSRGNQIKSFPASIREATVYRPAGWKEIALPIILKEPGIYQISGRVNNHQVKQLIAVNFPVDFTESNLEKFRTAEWPQISRGKFYYLTEKQFSRLREIILGKPAGLTFWLLLIIFLELELLWGWR